MEIVTETRHCACGGSLVLEVHLAEGPLMITRMLNIWEAQHTSPRCYQTTAQQANLIRMGGMVGPGTSIDILMHELHGFFSERMTDPSSGIIGIRSLAEASWRGEEGWALLDGQGNEFKVAVGMHALPGAVGPGGEPAHPVKLKSDPPPS